LPRPPAGDAAAFQDESIAPRKVMWSRKDNVAWKGQDVPGASGLTPFQERCEAQLTTYLADRNLVLRDRTLMLGHNETYLHGFLGDTGAEIFIYLDQVELNASGKGVNLERWDARTPDELIEKFLAAVNEAVRK